MLREPTEAFGRLRKVLRLRLLKCSNALLLGIPNPTVRSNSPSRLALRRSRCDERLVGNEPDQEHEAESDVRDREDLERRYLSDHLDQVAGQNHQSAHHERRDACPATGGYACFEMLPDMFRADEPQREDQRRRRNDVSL